MYDQILDNTTNILFEIWSTYYPSMEEFDTFAGQIRNFLRKDLVQWDITEFFAPNTLITTLCANEQLVKHFFTLDKFVQSKG